MQYKHLNVPEHWQHYWTRYPEGYTILEALISWVSQVDSMVDNQNTLNENVEQFRTEIDDFVSRFDERLQDEVVITLKDWQASGFLDDVINESLRWQLDDYITTNEQNLLTINEQLAQTMTQSEFDSWVATLLDGGPSIFVGSLSELQTTYPNGAEGVALVGGTDQAKIYVWNGTTWEDFGNYQGIEIKDNSVTSTKIADNVVTPRKTTFINQSKNLIIEYHPEWSFGGVVGSWVSVLESGHTYHNPDKQVAIAKVAPNTQYAISIEPATNIFVGQSNSLPKFTNNEFSLISDSGQYEKVSKSSPMLVTTKSTAQYLYISFDEGDFKAQLELGTVATEYQSPFKFDDNIGITNENIPDKLITADKIEDYAIEPNHLYDTKMTNYFDVTKLTKGGYLNNEGTLVSDPGYNHSDYILVTKGTWTITKSLSSAGVIYDLNKNYIAPIRTGGLPEGTPVTFTVSEPRYVRINSNNTNLYTTMLVKGSTVPAEYSEFGTTIPWLKIPQTSSKYEGLKWVVFGDSLTEVNATASKRYFDYVQDDFKIDVVNFGKSGSGYKTKDDLGTAFYQRISSIPTDADVITIFGSLNDYYSLLVDVPLGTVDDKTTDTVAGAINATIDNLFSIAPTIPLGIITPTPWEGSILGDNTNLHTQYVDMLIEIARKRGLPVLDLYNSSGLRPWDSTYRTLMYSRDNGDGIHPDENGHKLIYPQVREFIKTLI